MPDTMNDTRRVLLRLRRKFRRRQRVYGTHEFSQTAALRTAARATSDCADAVTAELVKLGKVKK